MGWETSAMRVRSTGTSCAESAPAVFRLPRALACSPSRKSRTNRMYERSTTGSPRRSASARVQVRNPCTVAAV
jgi:hypothetical protein